MTDQPVSPSFQFHTTHWTQVIAARGNSDEARLALRTLCDRYYEPVAMFIRRARDRHFLGNGIALGTTGETLVGEANDLTHEFFAKLLEGRSLDHVDRTRGRFRSYLLGAVKHFLADRIDSVNAIKRGGNLQIQPLMTQNDSDESTSAEFHSLDDPRGFPPDAYFDRQWGLAVVQRAIDTLRAEAVSQGERERFEVLQQWLVTPSAQDTGIEAARSLNLSDSAFKVAIHRLRKRFRQVVIEQISATVEDPSTVKDELNYLIAAVSYNVRNP